LRVPRPLRLRLFRGSRYNRGVVKWEEFEPADFEYDFARDKLALHGLTFEDAVEAFFSDFRVRKNKGYRDRFQLFGRTGGGRFVKIIFQLKPGRIVRIITGWPL
jgi:uncharacterized DUF497 family protein